MYAWTPDFPHLFYPLCIVVQKCVPLCGPMGILQSPLFWSLTLVRMYACSSPCIHVHITLHMHSNLLDSCVQTCASLYDPTYVPVVPVVNNSGTSDWR